MPNQNQEVTAETLIQQLEILLKDKNFTHEQQQEFLKKLVELGVLTEQDISKKNLKEIREAIKLHTDEKQRKSNKIDNKKLLYKILTGTAFIALGLAIPVLGYMPFIIGSSILISSAVQVGSKLFRMALKAYIKNHPKDTTDSNAPLSGKSEKLLKIFSRKNTDRAADLITAATLLSGGVYGLSQGVVLGLISITSGLVAAGNFVINNKVLGKIKKYIRRKSEENKEETTEERTTATSLSLEESPTVILQNIESIITPGNTNYLQQSALPLTSSSSLIGYSKQIQQIQQVPPNSNRREQERTKIVYL